LGILFKVIDDNTTKKLVTSACLCLSATACVYARRATVGKI